MSSNNFEFTGFEDDAFNDNEPEFENKEPDKPIGENISNIENSIFEEDIESEVSPVNESIDVDELNTNELLFDSFEDDAFNDNEPEFENKEPDKPIGEHKIIYKKKPNKKNLIFISAFSLFFLLLIIVGSLFFLNPKKDLKIEDFHPKTDIEDLKSEDSSGTINIGQNEEVSSGEEISFTSTSSGESLDNSGEITENGVKGSDIKRKSEDGNFEINVKKLNEDDGDIVNTNIALLSPYEKKIKISDTGEFDGSENNNNKGELVKKDEINNIPSISKANFIPDVKINIKETKQDFKVSDVINLSFDVILNSKSIKYSITNKTYGNDFVINLNLEDISSPIVSLEENIINEKIQIPLNMMIKGTHKVGIKVSNVTKAVYTFNIE